jgi:hypothetical protein
MEGGGGGGERGRRKNLSSGVKIPHKFYIIYFISNYYIAYDFFLKLFPPILLHLRL